MLSTWIEISRSALVSNIEHLKRLSGSAELGVVVKSNAYGHGILEIASLVEDIPSVSWLCTAGIAEAALLRRAGCKKKILVMAYNDDGDDETLIGSSIDIMVDDRDFVHKLNEKACKAGVQIRLHIKIDTGLSRRGVMPEFVVPFAQTILTLPGLQLAGVGTHLADTSSGETDNIHEQLLIFNRAIQNLEHHGIRVPSTHALSSGALTSVLCVQTFPRRCGGRESCGCSSYRYTMTRIGTHMYGLWKSKIQKEQMALANPDFFLRPVLTWKARLIDMRDVPAGVAIGYGSTFVTQRPSRIGLVPVGYADGYPRNLSQKASAFIDEKRVAVIGIISMNLMALDVTTIPHAATGMPVVLMGNYPEVLANTLAAQGDTVNNELITRISPEIKRIIVD